MEFFSQYGNVVDSYIVQERNDRGVSRSRGYGFVTFESAAEADEAVRRADGSEFMGREGLRVSIAFERPSN